MIPFALKALDILVCFLRKTWRPVTCFAVGIIMFGIGATIIVNGVALPLITKQALDLNGLGSLVTGTAALIASLGPFVLARSYEKTKGIE